MIFERLTLTGLENLSGLIFVFCIAIMLFWTVEDAGPYKKYPNFLMRTSLLALSFSHVVLSVGQK